jgi:hypothetical protein
MLTHYNNQINPFYAMYLIPHFKILTLLNIRHF